VSKLNDRVIRSNLIEKLKSQRINPSAILEELPVHNGNAIADVVALYKEAHCYEIKGDGDKIERAIKQGYYYNLSFRKITLVTTTKHIKKSVNILPKFWGIILAEEKNNKVILKYKRQAQNNPHFNKNIALLILWKSEMITLIKENKEKQQKNNKLTLAKLISNSKRKVELSYNISKLLLLRHYQLSSST
jgi:hypothetical protein